jgi:hypothetical protein
MIKIVSPHQITAFAYFVWGKSELVAGARINFRFSTWDYGFRIEHGMTKANLAPMGQRTAHSTGQAWVPL